MDAKTLENPIEQCRVLLRSARSEKALGKWTDIQAEPVYSRELFPRPASRSPNRPQHDPHGA